ncbi:MAG: hypothetical protein IIB62_04980 [Proteobacteria bacterium]|nr:hypothetical protein [Pseudomonadota bacterium]
MREGEAHDAGETATAAAPRLYTIAPSSPFLETLARAILEGDLPIKGGPPPEKLELSRWTILLPTRRAARALAETFLKISGESALLLPRIRPLGDVDEDALAPCLAASPHAEIIPALLAETHRMLNKEDAKRLSEK